MLVGLKVLEYFGGIGNTSCKGVKFFNPLTVVGALKRPEGV